MTLREEVINLSNDQQELDESFLEVAGQAFLKVAEPLVNLGIKTVEFAAGSPARLGATMSAVAFSAVVSALIDNRIKAKRVIQSLKINNEDKNKLEQITNSNESDQTKKNWITRILSKYAIKAKGSIKQAVQAEKDYRQEKKNIRDYKEEQRKAKELEKDQNKYIKRNFGNKEKYEDYKKWKSENNR